MCGWASRGTGDPRKVFLQLRRAVSEVRLKTIRPESTNAWRSGPPSAESRERPFPIPPRPIFAFVDTILSTKHRACSARVFLGSGDNGHGVLSFARLPGRGRNLLLR